MKWLPNRGANTQETHTQTYIRRRRLTLNSPAQLAKMVICLVGTGMFLSGDADILKSSALMSVSPQDIAEKVNHVASEISVKVVDQDFLGSGFIVQRLGPQYSVITNQHVLRAGKPPYFIETADGKTHAAQVASDLSKTSYPYDLAILNFNANATYPTAKIGSSLYLEVGEPVFAAGYPSSEASREANSQQSSAVKGLNPDNSSPLALKLGYQIGYTNDVKKGMSGGPLLNSMGEVVGVNGKHAYPLWESPEVYQDGSEPCSALQELITRSSLAIPIEKSIELDPQLAALRSLSNLEITRRSNLNLTEKKSQLVAKMQAIAQATTQSCQAGQQESVRNENEDDGNQ
jgi:serine protease Do